MRTFIVLGSLLLVAVMTSSGCDGATCVQVDHPVVTDPDSPLIIGGTYGDALSTIVGSRSGPLQWHEIEPAVEGLPAPGETRITVVIHEPSMAEQLDFEKKRSVPNERLTCSDWVLAYLEVELHSEDGALDVRLPATAKFYDPGEASILVRVGDEHLEPLGLRPSDPDAELLIQLTYYGYEDAPPPSGTLTLRSDSGGEGGNGVGMSVDLATWTLE